MIYPSFKELIETAEKKIKMVVKINQDHSANHLLPKQDIQ